MQFADKLKGLMAELNISQAKLSKLTGISKSSISQYLAGINEPTKSRKEEIATALGVQEDYFDRFLPPQAVVQKKHYLNIPPPLVAKLMGKSREWVEKGLQDGVFPWGYAVKMKVWSYWISPVKFTEYTGIKIPDINLQEENQKGA